MKIREVRFEKLFSLAKYNNERIGLTAEVEEGEDADKVVGELHFKILDIEDCLNAYRKVLEDLDYASDSFESKQSQILSLKEDAVNLKVKIAELLVAAEKGEVDARMQHACSGQSYKDLQERIARYEKEAKELDESVQRLAEVKQELRDRIKAGRFTLEGLTVPRVRRRDWY